MGARGPCVAAERLSRIGSTGHVPRSHGRCQAPGRPTEHGRIGENKPVCGVSVVGTDMSGAWHRTCLEPARPERGVGRGDEPCPPRGCRAQYGFARSRYAGASSLSLRAREADRLRIPVRDIAKPRIPLEQVEPHPGGEIAGAVPVRVRPDSRDRRRIPLGRERRRGRLGAGEKDARETIRLPAPRAADRKRSGMWQRAQRESHRLRLVAVAQVGEQAVAEDELALNADRAERVQRDVVLRVVSELEAVLDEPADRSLRCAAVSLECVPGT